MSHTAKQQKLCPKCYAPLPPGLYEQPGGSCHRCGLVFAKYRAAQASARHATPMPQDTPQRDWSGLLLAVPEELSAGRFYASLAGVLLFALWGWQLAMADLASGAIGQSFLHGPLLIFHEAGHVLFRLFGHFMMVLGGTLAQLLMPLVMLIALLRHNRDPLGASLALWLLGVSLLDVAPYVYDAYAPQLVLLNGQSGEAGGHDWIYLLGRLNLLSQSRLLGGLIHVAGIATLLTALLWAVLVLRRQWHHLQSTTARE